MDLQNIYNKTENSLHGSEAAAETVFNTADLELWVGQGYG
jgi:hypothetical protein